MKYPISNSPEDLITSSGDINRNDNPFNIIGGMYNVKLYK